MPLALVEAVVVNHNAGGALLECAASLRAAGVVDLVVVDNASVDGSLVALAAADATATLVATGENLGYGRAANVGARRSSSPYLLICNPDLVIEATALRELLEVLEAHDDWAAVGPKILDESGATYPSARRFPDYLDAAGHLLLGLIWPSNPFSRRYRREGELAKSAIDWLSGACLLLRRVAFDSVGGFDEDYFMYVEDLDLCWRLRRAGWSVGYAPEARVVHRQGLSAARHPLRMLAAHHHSTWRFAAKRAEGAERLLLPLIALALALRFVLAGARELARNGNSGAPAAD